MLRNQGLDAAIEAGKRSRALAAELPVTVAELRNMLALCAYSLEVEATAWRDLARHRKSKAGETYANRARSLDKQAANVRRMLSARMTAQGIETTIAEAARNGS